MTEKKIIFFFLKIFVLLKETKRNNCALGAQVVIYCLYYGVKYNNTSTPPPFNFVVLCFLLF